MQSYFSKDFFVQNRNKLRTACSGTSLIVVTANGLLQRTSDSAYSFQQDSNFWYLTGLEQPDVTLVMDGSAEYLIVPEQSNYQSIFDGVAEDEALKQLSGIEEVVPSSQGWTRLQVALQKQGKVGTPLAMSAYVEVYGMYTNPSRRQLAQKLRDHLETIELIDIRPELVTLRCHKQSAELAAMQAAIDVTIAGINHVTSQLPNYSYEYEIEADLSKSFRKVGAAGHAFMPIVAGGRRACTLHNVGNNAPLSQHELVILDVGAEVSHYAADISRTVIQGQPSSRQQAVYDAVLAVQQYALSLLKPGVLLQEYEKQVETYMGLQLVDLGLLDEAEAEAPANIRRYFPHATSHFLGLDVHDVGDYRIPLAASMVVTCEPGIYIPGEGIGVRVEDDVLITETGNTVLTVELPRTLQPVLI
jgi:Xaa-Pro aminopeptidase